MTGKLDLLKIAQEEQNGDLFKYLDGIFKRSKTQPVGISDAVIARILESRRPADKQMPEIGRAHV